MKVSVDSILGSAKRINSQRKNEDENSGDSRKDVKGDSISINSRVSSRIDKIEAEFKDVQNSLSRNQVLKNGIESLREDFSNGRKNQEEILNNTRFDDQKILADYMGKEINNDSIENKYNSTLQEIDNDLSKIKKLQVEVDNIAASNLIDESKLNNIIQNVDSVFENAEKFSTGRISRLNADSVRRLIK